MSTIRVNMRAKVNNSQIRRERAANGRQVLIVPSATLPDNVVMNRVLYPADEIAKSYKSLEDSPAPLGHPQIDGQLINANSPAAINGFWIGAHNANVRREGGRVLLDKVIDLEVAERTAEGQRVVDAVNSGQPIHTSTGLTLDLEPAPAGTAEYDWVGRNMKFDHDAILLDEPGAATPDQGVGMLVNGQRVQVSHVNVADAVVTAEHSLDQRRDRARAAINGWLTDMSDTHVVFEGREDDKLYAQAYTDDGVTFALTGAPELVTRSTSWVRKLPLVNRLLSLLDSGANEDTTLLNDDEVTTMDKTELEAILAANAEATAKAVTEAVKPLADSLASVTEAVTANARAAEADKRAEVEKVLGKAAADALTGNALNEAHKSLVTGNTAALNTAGGQDKGRDAYNTAPEA